MNGVCAGIQYDTRLDNVATGNGTIEYRRDENRLVQQLSLRQPGIYSGHAAVIFHRGTI